MGDRTVQGYEFLATLVFTDMMARLFSAITGDENPIHMNAASARHGPFGRPANFGALTLFAMLVRSNADIDDSCLKVDASFIQPVFFNLPYLLYRRSEAGKETLRLTNGQTVVAELLVQRNPGTLSPWAPGTGLADTFELHRAALPLLCAALGVDATKIPIDILTILGWSSYFVGMKLDQGRRWLASISLELYRGSSTSDVTVLECMVNDGAVMAVHHLGDAAAKVKIQTKTQGIAPRDVAPRQDMALPWNRALIVGASRGLGAAIASVLRTSGAHTIELSRAIARSKAHGDPRPSAGAVILHGDAGDPDWCAEAATLIEAAYPSIDLLVLAAAPPAPVVTWKPGHIEQIRAYMDESIRLILYPLTWFLPLLSDGGSAMLISSQAVLAASDRKLVSQRASKSAAEALFSSAIQYRKGLTASIIRAPRFLSDQTAGSMGSAQLPTVEAIAIAALSAVNRRGREAGLSIIEADELRSNSPLSLTATRS
uniref:MaoC domain protein dehydratase n=1 Tax=Rhodopseudomonas palustris (strain DX-1) TaxID=652103 RepID=E6VQ42_RHOPX